MRANFVFDAIQNAFRPMQKPFQKMFAFESEALRSY